MTQTIDTPAIRSVRKTGPGAWLVVFEDGLRYPCVGGFRDEADVRETAMDVRTEARAPRYSSGEYTVARMERNGDFVSLTERYDTRDAADLVAQRLQDETGVEHGSFFGIAEDYREPAF